MITEDLPVHYTHRDLEAFASEKALVVLQPIAL